VTSESFDPDRGDEARSGMRHRCAGMMMKSSRALLVSALSLAFAGAAYAGNQGDLNGLNQKVCGKWVYKLEDGRKRKVTNFGQFYNAANQDPDTVEVGLTIIAQTNNRMILAITNPNFNTGTPVPRFIFGTYKKKGKKLKFKTNLAGTTPPGDIFLAAQFDDMVRLVSGGEVNLQNVQVDRSRKYKFKGRFSKGHIRKLKLKATMSYDVAFPLSNPTKPTKLSQRGRFKFRGKSKSCAAEQF
jgi:hypothetical protein